MQRRQLQFQDFSNKCALVLMSASPEKNLKLLSDSVRTAFVVYKDGLYYVDKDAANNQCARLKIDGKKLGELLHKLGLKDVAPKKDETVTLIENMSSEQLGMVYSLSQFFPTWLHTALFLAQKSAELHKQVCAAEAELRVLEQKISILEAVCPKKFGPADLEKIYPNEYKKTAVRPTDYKIIKLEELKARIQFLQRSENTVALAAQKSELTAVVVKFSTLKPQYLSLVEQFQLADNELSEYSKNSLTADAFRPIVRSDIARLSLESRVAAVSIMPGATSLGALIDILAQLKKTYEAALVKAYAEATGKSLQLVTFEQLFLERFKKPAKEHFKEFCKKPIAEMQDIKGEFKRLNEEFWKNAHQTIINEEKLKAFNDCFLTLLYLACVHETFRFTDKVQRLNASAAIGGLVGSIVGKGENIAGEFLLNLSAVQVQNSFAMIPFCSEMMTPLEEANAMWLEVAIWLYGVHMRSFDQIAPYLKENGVINPAVFRHLADDDDRKFFEKKPPLVKWTLAQYHEQHSKNILLKMPQTLVAHLLPLMPDDCQAQYRTNYGLPQPIVSQVVLPVPAAATASTPHSAASAEVEAKRVTVQSPVSLFQSADKQAPVRKLLQFADLEKIKDHENLTKFLILNSKLLSADLTEDQNKIIESLKTPILNILRNYKDAYLSSTWRIPTFIKAQRHIELVTNAYNSINDSASPREYILELYKVWNSVYGDKSTTVGPSAEIILESAFNILHSTSAEQAQEVKQASVCRQ